MKKQKKQQTKPKKSPVRIIVITLLILCLLAAVGAACVVAYLYPKVPALDTSRFDYVENSIIYDKDGNYYQSLEGDENRQVIASEEIPDQVKNAFIAIEDRRFYKHHGVDLRGTARAVFEVLTNQNLEGSGGSTITQQLIKQTHLTSDRSIARKFNEWILATRLEKVYSKDQILTAYLNKINFHGADGIQAAARQYFDKAPKDLSVAQSAVLAAIPNSPSYYDPYTYDAEGHILKNADGTIALNPNNLSRAGRVITKMAEEGYITEDEAQAARSELESGAGLVYNNPNKVYSYFTDAVYNQLLLDLQRTMHYDEDEAAAYINKAGLKIYSTVDPAVQSAMESAAADDSLFPEQSAEAAAASEATGKNFIPQVGMTVINNADGSVSGMVGGRDNNASLSLNRAQSRFQPGSSTKPLTVFAPALEEKRATLASVYNDVPIDLKGWRPQNAERTFTGPMTIRDALIHSNNIVTVQTWQDLGSASSASYGKRLGLDIEDSDKTGAALALGGYTYGQTPEQMAAAYATFANKGVYTEPYLYTKVEDKDGNVILTHEPAKTQVFSPETSYLITDALRQAATNGTAHINAAGRDIAGKTGTTDDEMHAWFCGYTPDYTMSVWYGYDENQVDTESGDYRLNIGLAGGEKPGPAAMFERVITELPTQGKTFERPANLKTAEIDKSSGKLATNLTDLDPRGSQRITEIFADGTVPTEKDDVHVAASFDTSTGYKAGPNCPKQAVHERALIDLSKIAFPTGITPVQQNYVPENLKNFLTTSQSCPVH